ncbi:MAG: hypothetical protein ACLQU1_27145 [Bryobacteraceae bacterium]
MKAPVFWDSLFRASAGAVLDGHPMIAWKHAARPASMQLASAGAGARFNRFWYSVAAV